MASTDTPAPAPEPEKKAPPPVAPAPEPEKKAPPPVAPAPEPEKVAPPREAPPPVSKAPPPTEYFVVVDLVLRFLLFASTLISVVVMVTSKQTKLIPVMGIPFPVLLSAKFNHSPAFIYFVAALSVACFYSIITTVVSFFALLKPGCSTKLLFHFVIIDVVMLGIVASATGAAGGVAYIGLRGNKHVGWQKVCNNYDKFCEHVGASIFLSLFASVLLLLLVLLSVYSLSRKIPK
ncbi:CASP-like protein 1 [Cornus florida]|uniref:CASP-like protein 1 n=1 Tax=Cornus florida TaxID=4283 RepID=UPI0028990B2F|nr:CASP-like protein 1 [Cornus florida]